MSSSDIPTFLAQPSLRWSTPTGFINVCGMAGDLAIQRQYQGFPVTFTGATGYTGPQGLPGSGGGTGPTGPAGGGAGPTGPAGGILAYATAVGAAAATVVANGSVVFDLGGTVYPNSGITPPAVAGTTFTIVSTGVYEFNFYVCATNGADSTQAVQMGIFVNGAQASSPNAPGYRYQTSLGTTAGNVNICIGEGLISLTAGDAVTLNNVTNSGTTPIDFLAPSVVGSGVTQAGATRVLTLKRIA